MICKVVMCYQLRCSNTPLEKSIDTGDNPMCRLQRSVHGVSSKSRVPWEWCVKQVVQFMQSSLCV